MNIPEKLRALADEIESQPKPQTLREKFASHLIQKGFADYSKTQGIVLSDATRIATEHAVEVVGKLYTAGQETAQSEIDDFRNKLIHHLKKSSGIDNNTD